MVYGLGVVYATDNMPRRDVAVNHHMYLLQCCSHVNDVRFLSSLGSFLGSLGCVTSCWTRWRAATTGRTSTGLAEARGTGCNARREVEDIDCSK